MKRFLALLIVAICIVPAVDAQVRKAERARKKQQFQEALGFVDIALEKNAEDGKAYQALGRIHQDMAAMTSGEEYLSHLKSMKEAFDEAMRLNEKLEDDIIGMLSLAYVQEFRKAIDDFNRGASTDTTSYFLAAAELFEGASIIGPDSSQAYFNWFLALLRADDQKGAIRPLELSVENGQPDSVVYDYLGRMYLSEERADDAVALMEEATVHFPDHEGLQSVLLSAYGATGNSDQALEAYAKKVAESPENALYRYNYGTFLLQTEKYDEAVAQYQEVIRIKPDYIDAHYNLGAAYINMAVATNDAANAVDDSMRTSRDTLSEEEETAMTAQVQDMVDERRRLFGLAIEPLEAAKSLSEQEGREVTQGICYALYQAYAQTNEMEKIATVEECAGI